MSHLIRPILSNSAHDGKRAHSQVVYDLVVTLVGTVVGIVLTVGVTYCSEKREREDLARKAVMLTIHNLDVSIRSTERLIAEMERQDSILNYVRFRQSSVGNISPDTLDMFISALYAHRVRPIDSSTETVFSSDFDIWKSLEDPKVIGRISNCYSIMRKCGEEYERFEKDKYDSFTQVYDNLDASSCRSDADVVKKHLVQNGIMRIIDAMPLNILLLKQLTESAKTLNQRNKSELGIRQHELDEIGKLL